MVAPVFEEVANGFQVVLFNEKIQGNPDGGVNDGVNDGVNLLLQKIKENPGVRTSSLKKEFKVSQRTLERWIKELRKEEKIEFRGAPKTGGYYLRDKKT